MTLSARIGAGASAAIRIAAHKTTRRARLIEIDPLYVDRIIRRWEAYAKDDAILEGTHQTFSDISREWLSQRKFA